MVLAVGGLGVWLVVAHSLWERPDDSRDPALIRRANAATVLTILLGLLFSYLVLYMAVLGVVRRRGDVRAVHWDEYARENGCAETSNRTTMEIGSEAPPALGREWWGTMST